MNLLHLFLLLLAVVLLLRLANWCLARMGEEVARGKAAEHVVLDLLDDERSIGMERLEVLRHLAKAGCSRGLARSVVHRLKRLGLIREHDRHGGTPLVWYELTDLGQGVIHCRDLGLGRAPA